MLIFQGVKDCVYRIVWRKMEGNQSYTEKTVSHCTCTLQSEILIKSCDVFLVIFKSSLFKTPFLWLRPRWPWVQAKGAEQIRQRKHTWSVRQATGRQKYGFGTTLRVLVGKHRVVQQDVKQLTPGHRDRLTDMNQNMWNVFLLMERVVLDVVLQYPKWISIVIHGKATCFSHFSSRLICLRYASRSLPKQRMFGQWAYFVRWGMSHVFLWEVLVQMGPHGSMVWW